MVIDIIRPSGSHQWEPCNGSQAMQTGLPEDESDAAKEGTAIHWVASEILTSFIKPDAELKLADDFLNTLAPNDVYIDEEMLECAMVYVNHILEYINETGTMQNAHVEEEMQLDCIYPGMRGTPDLWIYNPNVPEIMLWDLKGGYGYVEEFQNPQLIIYMKGIMDKLEIDGIADQYIQCRMTIVQPRSFSTGGSIREWSVKGSDLRGYVNKIKVNATMAMSGHGSCDPGIHCRYCLARSSCKALQQTVYNAIDVSTGISPTNLTGNDLAFELQLLKRASELLNYRITAIETQVESELRGGKLLPGFSLEQGYGRKRWTKGIDNKNTLLFMDSMGVDIRKPDVFITPTQALTKLKAAYKKLNIKLDDNVISQYTETPKSKMKVIEENPNNIKKIFSKRKT